MSNILLASLGANRLHEISYSFNGREFSSSFSCLALARLLQVEFDSLYVLLTEEARKTHEKELIAQAKELDLVIRIVDITSGKTIEEIWQMFDQITESFPSTKPVNAYLDISNGFRHLPLLSFASLTYLESSRNFRLAGVHYGAFEARSNDVAPVFDLTPLVNIIKGSFAVQAFEETGAVNQLGNFLNDLLSIDEKGRKDLDGRLNKLHQAMNAGLSIETGDEAARLCWWIDKNLPDNSGLKAANDLVARLKERIDRIKTVDKNKKNMHQLTIDELKRQLELIAWHIDTQNADTALLLLREWVVNRVWLAEKPEGNWLHVKNRERLIERNLGFWATKLRKADDSLKAQAFYELIRNWNQITNKRNEYAHAGFRLEVVKSDKLHDFAKNFYEKCLEEFSDSEFWKLPHRKSDGHKVLVTGMGASFGLLYSAVSLTKADVVIVVTSEKFRDKASEACQKSGFNNPDSLHTLIMQDVFCGFSETPALLKECWPLIKNAESVVVNLTGGTTAMQWVMQSVFERACNEHLPVERVAFVDRRPSVDQQQDPWHLGEIIEVEKIINQKY